MRYLLSKYSSSNWNRQGWLMSLGTLLVLLLYACFRSWMELTSTDALLHAQPFAVLHVFDSTTAYVPCSRLMPAVCDIRNMTIQNLLKDLVKLSHHFDSFGHGAQADLGHVIHCLLQWRHVLKPTLPGCLGSVRSSFIWHFKHLLIRPWRSTRKYSLFGNSTEKLPWMHPS